MNRGAVPGGRGGIAVVGNRGRFRDGYAVGVQLGVVVVVGVGLKVHVDLEREDGFEVDVLEISGNLVAVVLVVQIVETEQL